MNQQKINPFQYLQVKLPTWGLFLLGLLPIIVQYAMDQQVIPTQYHALILVVLLPLLRELGKRIPQPELHQPQITSVSQFAAVAQSTDLAWMTEAKKHVGLKENTSKTAHNPTILAWLKSLGAWWKEDETPWCGTFVAHCLKVAGVKYPKHWYRALDYINYGTKLKKPAYGCVAIKTRKGGGHVCFVVGRDTKTGKLVCLGGNQSNAVSYALYADSEFQEFRWYGLTNQPAPHRYELQKISNITATKVTEL